MLTGNPAQHMSLIHCQMLSLSQNKKCTKCFLMGMGSQQDKKFKKSGTNQNATYEYLMIFKCTEKAT